MLPLSGGYRVVPRGASVGLRQEAGWWSWLLVCPCQGVAAPLSYFHHGRCSERIWLMRAQWDEGSQQTGSSSMLGLFSLAQPSSATPEGSPPNLRHTTDLWHRLGMAGLGGGSPLEGSFGQTEHVRLRGHEGLIFYDMWISWVAQGHSLVHMSCRGSVGTIPWQGCAHSTGIHCFFGFLIYWYLEGPE